MAKQKQKKIRKNIVRGIAHIKATHNNTIVTITDTNGEALAWDSAGTIGFKGARKSTPFAATRAGEQVGQKVRKMGVTEVEVKITGTGAGPRVRRPGPRLHRHPRHRHRGPHPGPPQRLPPQARSAASDTRRATAPRRRTHGHPASPHGAPGRTNPRIGQKAGRPQRGTPSRQPNAGPVPKAPLQ
jgi:small subunit ribosomal protein S11